VLDAYAAGLHGLDGWLHSLGGATERFDPPPARLPAPFPSWPYLPGGPSIEYRVVAGGAGRRGEALWHLLDAAVRARGIEVRYHTAAERLALGPDGAVTGLVARPGGLTDALVFGQLAGAGAAQRAAAALTPSATAAPSGSTPSASTPSASTGRSRG
jgi:succinate dehydrogenase/fumarate reductase flavoprotein subunit